MRTRTLSRAAALTSVTRQPRTGYDDEGAPGYGDAETFRARVVHEDALVRNADGSEERSTLTLYAPGGQDSMPERGDRLTVDGGAYVALERTVAVRIDDTVDHVRIRARDE